MGERALEAATKSELSQSLVRLAVFVELFLDSSTVRVWSGVGNYTLNAVVFTGVGSFGGIDKIEEDAGDIKASGVALTLSGIPTANISMVLNEDFQGRKVIIWVAFFDLNWAVIGNAVRLFQGRADYPVIDEDGETAKITVFAENQLIDLERPRVRRFTHEDQIFLNPGDLGLEFVASIQNKEVIWKEHL